MLNTEFYDILDAELTQLVEDNGFLPALKHKNKEQNKPFALLLWFLRLYGRTFRYSQYITEGRGDSSCDIIFDVEDTKKRKVYYVVQAKWNNKRNSNTKIDTKEFKATLDDFRLVFLGRKKETDNENFNEKYSELKHHLAQNGKVKFIYFTLCNTNPEVEDNTAAFEKECSDLQILDINRIKRDYINYRYKQIISDNPLESAYLPNEEIELKIERLDIAKNFIEINRPFISHIFLIRPKVIFELFETYKNKIFFKNVRNPLLNSTVNDNIEATLKDEVPFFWYYNNGITAVTNGIINGGVNNAVTDIITVAGFQVINGAQTVHSVHKSYLDASSFERDTMDRDAFLTLRLLTVNSNDTITRITRFTNSQNPMEGRDFRANDEVQTRLQEESFDTSYWYEKRRGEFSKDIPEGVVVVSNKDLAICHYLFNLDKSQGLSDYIYELPNYTFLTEKEDKRGLYDKIFIENTITFKQMLAAYLFVKIVPDFNPSENDVPTNGILSIIPLARIILEKYLDYMKEPKSMYEYIIDNAEKNTQIFAKIILFTFSLVFDFPNNPDKEDNRLATVFKNLSVYDNIRTRLEKIEMTDEIIQEIEQIDPKNPPHTQG